MRDLGKEVNRLVDRLESGDLNRRQFITAVTALGVMSTGFGTLVKAGAAESGEIAPDAGGFGHSGFVVRISQVDPQGGNSIEGLVQPGVLQFSQTCAAGPYRHTTVSGSAVIKVQGTLNTVPAGEELVIPAGKPFTYINNGGKSYRFRASHPFWSPGDFTYGYGGAQLAGDEVWFEIKRTATEKSTGTVYRVLPAAGTATLAVVSVPAGGKTLAMKNTTGQNVLSTISGTVQVATSGEGAQGAETTQSLARGGEAIVEPNASLVIQNSSSQAAMVEIRPEPATTWGPETQLWEGADGQLVTGDRVWFELVLPS